MQFKTRARVAAGLGAILAVVYFTLPASHAFVLASAPILLPLICPVMMLVKMFTMRGNTGVAAHRATKPGHTAAAVDADDAALGAAASRRATKLLTTAAVCSSSTHGVNCG